MRWGQHDHWQSFRERDYERFRDETAERERVGLAKRRRVRGRILEPVVGVDVALGGDVAVVGRAQLTVQHT